MPPKQVPSFDEIIQAGRQRTQHEALANEIFGRGRKSATKQTRNVPREAPPPYSLASRITPAGVGKRSASTSSIKPNKAPPRPASAAALKARSNRIEAALEAAEAQTNIVPSNKANGISIRGISSGPFFIQASNFAPGTTAADIESALLSVANGATEETLTYCRIITNSPTVIAEMSFTDRAVAEQVISTFNGQKADGRILHVHFKSEPIGPRNPKGKGFLAAKTHPRADNPYTSPAPPTVASAPKELIPEPVDDTAMQDVVDVATSSSQAVAADPYDAHRSNADRERETRRGGAEPEFQDGNYGFADPNPAPKQPPTEPRGEEPSRSSTSYRDGGSGRDDKDLYYDKDRDRDRDEKRYDDRGGRYSRGDSYSHRRDDKYDKGYDTQGRGGFGGRGNDWRGPPPPYPRRADRGRGEWTHGRGGGYGRMYSDDVTRGGRSRGGGGYR